MGVGIPSAHHRGRAPSKEMLAEGEKTSAWLLATKSTESRRDIAPCGLVSHYPARLGREQRLQPEGFSLALRRGSKPLRKHSLKSWAAERVTVGHQGHISLYKHSNLLSPNPDFYFSVGFTEKFSKINFTAKDYEQGFGKAS